MLHDDRDNVRRQGNDVPLTLTYTPATSTPNVWTMQASVNGSTIQLRCHIDLRLDGQLESYAVTVAPRRRSRAGLDSQLPSAPDGLQLEREGDQLVFPASTTNNSVSQYTTAQTSCG